MRRRVPQYGLSFFRQKHFPRRDLACDFQTRTARHGRASTTHLMAHDAVNRGFQAVVFQARHPLQALRLCQELGIRAILNHSLQKGSPAGHYSVLVGLNDREVILHDPLFGPERRFSHAELLALWQPQVSNSEILGNVLIGIGGAAPAKLECEFCHTPLPPKDQLPEVQETCRSTTRSDIGLHARWLHRAHVESCLLPRLRLHVDF